MTDTLPQTIVHTNLPDRQMMYAVEDLDTLNERRRVAVAREELMHLTIIRALQPVAAAIHPSAVKLIEPV